MLRCLLFGHKGIIWSGIEIPFTAEGVFRQAGFCPRCRLVVWRLEWPLARRQVDPTDREPKPGDFGVTP